ncbi:DEAD/DEAH box helicase family protein [Patescibacteria group bacterium]|nr:DEAD/DEAH box helicase family protein [Patescibacteria group bacterium]
MSLNSNFPQSPHEILDPSIRWVPGEESLKDKGGAMYKLLPPFVHKLRKEVKEWRDNNYKGATETSIALLNWWFKNPHYLKNSDGIDFEFKYYFAQRESVETIIYLYDVIKVKDKYDLLRFDESGIVSPSMFSEDWKRFVIKMATGSGKTKVMSLLLAWSYFHKKYEENSDLSKNFLVITPNIIVLDRIYSDFKGLKIFFEDPVLPENGFKGRDWKNDFQLKLHLQDNISNISNTGNIFLTNIHRVYDSNNKISSIEDENLTNYFLGEKSVTNAIDTKVDLGEIVRNIEELVIINDEAHHIHDEKLAWFKSIEDIDNKLKQKGKRLSLQIDLTATPKHDKGGIFVQTISDYPLVEAIRQNVVKHPILPEESSRARLIEKQSSIYTEKYEDFLQLGYEEWKKSYNEHIKMNKKTVLFIMTDDTKNCDEVKEFLESKYTEFKNSVLVIHTKDNGEITETSTGKAKEELERLRKEADNIDSLESPYKVIVSVLMLKEGWDVKNVTTIVGLRAYSSKSNILPEQTLGRGLRRMYRERKDIEEYVSVIGTTAFMDFVESIKSEGVEFEKRKMGFDTNPITPLVIEIDKENEKKDLEKMDIKIPILTPRIYKEYKNLSDLNLNNFSNKKLIIKEFSEQEKREIIFRDIDSGEVNHKIFLDNNSVPDYTSVVGFFTQSILKEVRLFNGYDILYPKVREFIQKYLFDKEIDLNNLNILRNLSEIEARNIIINIFTKEINSLTILDKGEAEVKDYIKVGQSRPFIWKDQGYLIPKKSVFNKIVGDSVFELEFANLLEKFDDIISYVKNYFSINFKIEYKNSDGEIKHYYPDFIVKKNEKEVYIIETKGREDLDDIEKIKRLAVWCEDINKAQNEVKFNYLYIKQEDYNKEKFNSFDELVRYFKL